MAVGIAKADLQRKSNCLPAYSRTFVNSLSKTPFYMKKLLLSSILALICFVASAQLADSLKSQMIRDWERAKAYTKEYLDAMPKDKYSFKANDSVRSFAQQMLHLAQGNVGLAVNGTGGERMWAGANLERSTTAQSADSVNYYVMTSYDYVINGIKNLDMSRYLELTG